MGSDFIDKEVHIENGTAGNVVRRRDAIWWSDFIEKETCSREQQTLLISCKETLYGSQISYFIDKEAHMCCDLAGSVGSRQHRF